MTKHSVRHGDPALVGGLYCGGPSGQLSRTRAVGSVKVTKVALTLRNSLESSRRADAGNLGVAGLASPPVADHGNLPRLRGLLLSAATATTGCRTVRFRSRWIFFAAVIRLPLNMTIVRRKGRSYPP